MINIIIWIVVIYLIVRHVKKKKQEESARQEALQTEQERLRMEQAAKEKERREKLEQEERERQKQARQEQLQKEIDIKFKQVSIGANGIYKDIRNFLMKEYSPTTIINGRYYAVKDTTYYDVSNDLTHKIKSLQSYISDLKKTNNTLINEYSNENGNAVISDAESKLFQAEAAIANFEAFYQRLGSLPSIKMMDEKAYGTINSSYWEAVRGMVRADAVRYVSSCDEYITNGNIEKIYTIDIEKLLRCVWYFATEKPFSASDFQKATSVFNRVYKQSQADVFIANLYAKNNVGGENAIREYVRNIPDQLLSSHIASSLMWMNAYQTELAVLQRMLSAGIEMTAKMQERLHSLSNGGGKIPSGFDVKSSANEFYFDVSALAWKDDEYVGLFENLAFKDKPLTYSLAIREENKELFIPQGINIPDTAGIVNKINSVFFEEYGNGVKVRSANCIALSGSGEEKLEGVLVSPGDCKQMGILMYMTRIGKKLIIRFYTLFVPNGSDLPAQKQQALSLYKKLSPSAAMWESSLKDTILMAVEQILNSSVQGNDTPPTNPSSGIGDEPVF